MSWNEGYHTSVEYTTGYYRDLSPAIIDFALLNKRLARPSNGPVKYLELGFGHGLSLNVHAAGNAGEFWGTDFAAPQVVNALHLSGGAGSQVKILNDSFEQLAQRADLPQFDFIALHGIWSWVSPEVRAQLLHLLDRHLAPGGAAYVSYNCQPGWAALFPMARLLDIHARQQGEKPIKARVEASLDFLDELSEAGGRFFSVNPVIKDFVKHLRTKDPRYIAHENFQQNLYCPPFADVAAAMATAKLSFAAPALMLDHVHGLHFTPAGGRILSNIHDPVLRETTRDYLVNAQFRCDIYTKGTITLSPYEQRARIAATPIVLTSPPSDVKLEANGGLGSLSLKPEIYNPVLETISNRKTPITLGELAQHKDLQSLPADHILEAITVLIGLGAACPGRDTKVVEESRARCRALNRALRVRAESTDESMILVSPVTGTGVPVPQIYQFFMSAEAAGITKKDDIIHHVHNILRRDDPLRPHDPPRPKDPTTLSTLAQDLDGYKKRLPIYRLLELV